MVNDQHMDDNEQRRKRRPAFYLLGAAALLGAGYFGYWSATNKPSIVEKVIEKATETATGETKATTPPATAGTEQSKVATAEVPLADPAKTAEEKALAEKPAENATTSATSETQVAVTPKATVEAARPKAAEPAPEIEPDQQAVMQPDVAQPEKPADDLEKVEPAAAAVPPPPVEVAPSFDTVRVEPDGTALIAGRATPGTEVNVMINGALVGKATANAEGSFVLIPDKPLPAGAGTLTLETRNGESVIVSDTSVAVAIKEQAKGEALVAIVKPDEPAKVVQAPSSGADQSPAKKVVLDSVDYDSEGNIIFSGRSLPGNIVRIYVDNAVAGEVTANAEGKWTFDGRTAIAPGTHALRADEVDASGKVISRVELPFQREEAAKVAAIQTPADGQKIGVKTGGSNAVPQRVIIQPGNNLWRLSRLVYGKGMQFTVIYEANKDQIRNPDLIYPGQVFSMPLKQ